MQQLENKNTIQKRIQTRSERQAIASSIPSECATGTNEGLALAITHTYIRHAWSWVALCCLGSDCDSLTVMTVHKCLRYVYNIERQTYNKKRHSMPVSDGGLA